MTIITLIGEVSYDLSPAATYVRVSIPDYDGIPMAIKATREGFDRYLFSKGRIVEVRQSRRESDLRRFAISRVFEDHKSVTVCGSNVETALARGYGGKPMEKVKFYLNSNYFDHPNMKNVMIRTLNIRAGEFLGTRDQGTGLTIICTTDQFARFLIERNQNGIKNGFMDLGATLIHSKSPPDAYERLAKIVGITRDQAKKVALALCYSGADEIMRRMGPHTPRDCAREIDVSDR
jgi:hypothetical protein